MAAVILIIHLIIAAAMIGVVLMQKSEGGALGIGGSAGGGGGGFLTGRGQANLLTRVTAGLAMAFFATSIALTVLGQRTDSDESIFDKATTPAATEKSGTIDGTTDKAAPTSPTEEPSGGILDKLK